VTKEKENATRVGDRSTKQKREIKKKKACLDGEGRERKGGRLGGSK